MSDTDSECRMAVCTFDRRMVATSESTSAKSCHSAAMTLPRRDSMLSVCNLLSIILIRFSMQCVLSELTKSLLFDCKAPFLRRDSVIVTCINYSYYYHHSHHLRLVPIFFLNLPLRQAPWLIN